MNKNKIPKGYYCYTRKDNKIIACPYWSMNKDKPEQENGYCSYIKKGDWKINKEIKVKILYKNGKKCSGKWQTGNTLGLPLSLLWDMCKECGINIGDKIE